MSFEKIFNSLAKHKHRYDVFQDFVVLSAVALQNSVSKTKSLEDEYMRRIKDYSKDDALIFSKLFAELVLKLDKEPRDVLGELYMRLEISNKNSGQYFSPEIV